MKYSSTTEQEKKELVWLQQWMYGQKHGTYISILIYTIDVQEKMRYVLINWW